MSLPPEPLPPKIVGSSNSRETVLPSDERTAGRALTPLAGVKIAHLGHFDPEYSRNRIMAKALRRAGATVVTSSDRRPFARRTPQLVRVLLRSRPDALLVGFPGHGDVPLARLVATRWRVPVLFDAFVSLYETEVEDRGLRTPGSAQALRCATEDRLACLLAHRVILDTDTHLRYFEEHLHVPRKRLRRIWVGADDDVMRPGPNPDDSKFRVFVYGSFIPLHGLEHVVRAAAVLERSGQDVQIGIAGSGQTEADVRRLASELGTRTVRFLGQRPYQELPALMASSHVCLGVFGTSGKAARVIPNKVFDALAVARPVITADTPAAREVLTHGENAWLCSPGDPDALAAAILALRSNDTTRQRIAEAGHRLFTRRFSIEALSLDVTATVLDTITR